MIKELKVEKIDKDFLNKTKYILDECKIDFKDILVNKPWGHEYLLYENEYCAVWVLYIKYMENTSMHCHINKNTSLICLDGLVSSNTLSFNNILNPFDALILEKGLFHQTNSIDKNGSYVLEIETPVNKFDLVRINDSYGRRGKDYEDIKFYENRDNLTLNNETNIFKYINDVFVQIIIYKCDNFNKDNFKENSLVSVLSKNELMGKVIYLENLNLDFLEENSILLIISKK